MKPLTASILTTALTALTTAGAQCIPSPTFAFGGQVKITYPKPGGTASVTQKCDAQAARLKQDLIAQARKAGIGVNWAEVYVVRGWDSMFHSGIYQLRGQGFEQTKYRKFRMTGWQDGEHLVYENQAAKKFVGMTSQPVSGVKNATLFVLYGN